MASPYEAFDPQKLPKDIFISSGTASNVREYQGSKLVNLYNNDITGADQNKLLQNFEKFSPDYRKAIAQKLKAAGYYRGDVTGKPTMKLQEAFFKAYEDLDFSNRQRLTAYAGDPAQAYNVQLDDLDTFLAKQDTGGGDGDGGFKIIQQQKKYSPDTIESIIDKVFSDLTGTGASKAQIAKYTKNIQKQLANPKNLAQTEYKDMGGGVQRQIVTEAAFDPESYLIEEVSKGDPAKASSIMGFYEVFNKFIGRG
jgi:hypothetical protein